MNPYAIRRGIDFDFASRLHVELAVFDSAICD